ncbi:MAG: hypothetical protein ACI9B9_000415 [Halioglobus sp.]|jgi:hypothetical protein
MVMDIGSAMKMLGSIVQTSMKSAQASPSSIEKFISLEDTGDNETIAGIEGDVYELKFEDQDSTVQTESLVLSVHATWRMLYTLWARRCLKHLAVM